MKRTAIIIIAAACIAASVEASTRLKDLVFIPLSQPNKTYNHGYIEHRLRITNESHRNRYTVRLEAPAFKYGSYGDSIERIERTVVIGPRTTVEVTLPTQALRISGNNSVKVFVDGSEWGQIALQSLTTRFKQNGSNAISILASRSINGQTLEDKINGVKTTPTAAGSVAHIPSHILSSTQKDSVTRAELELSDWSSNWTAYSCFDAVVLYKSDLAKLSPAVLEALRQYVSAGGTLAVLGTQTFPFDKSNISFNSNKTAADYKVVFGRVLLFTTEKTEDLQEGQLQKLTDSAKETLGPWEHSYNLANANKQFSVIGDMSLPTRGMYLIMLTFAIIIGPVLLIVLSRKNKRIWMLWMVPSISFSVCVVITIYSVFSEGITPSARMKCITLLNQNTHQAVTIGMLGLYCPLTPAGGLHFNTLTEISPYVESNYSSGTGKSIDWTRDQNLYRGWVSARVPSYYQIRIPEIRRERLELVTKNGETEIINGLGADIKQLWLLDSNGKWMTIKNKLNSGAKGRLIELSGSQGITPNNDLRSIYKSAEWPEKFKQIPDSRIKLLKPNMYLAVLDGAPFMNHGLQGRVHERSKSYIIGILPTQKGER